MNTTRTNNNDNNNESPQIFSLEEFNVSLPNETRNLLEVQMAGFDGGSNNNNNNDNNDSTKSNLLLQNVLSKLKIPPQITICRINLIKSTSKEVMNEIQHFLDKDWASKFNVKLLIQQHPHFNDVVTLQTIDNDQKTTTTTTNFTDCIYYSLRKPPTSTSTNQYNNAASSSLFVHGWPRRERHGWPMNHRVVIVDRFCGEAVLRGSDIFVRGILVADTGIMVDEVVAVYADVQRKPPHRGMNIQNYNGCCIFLGLGNARCTRSTMFSSQTGIGVQMTKHRAGPLLPPLHGALENGTFMLQNLPSILVGHALDPFPGDVILDMCCAPGGKTAHIASLMRNQGILVACDKSRKKMIATRDLLRTTMGATIVFPICLDTTKCILSQNDKERMSVKTILDEASCEEGLWNVEGFYPESFDRILLDPPCSALGLRPKLRIDVSPKELRKHAEYQYKFVERAITLLKPGGVMTYSTCTLNALENEGVVAHILTKFGHIMELVTLPFTYGCSGFASCGLDEKSRQLVRRFDPSDEDLDCMGFFLAKFRKLETLTKD